MRTVQKLSGVDAFPICLDTQDVDEIVSTVKNIAPSFGGINLEDISAPRCFEVERRLQEVLDIPIFHDDQHGTAIVCSAAMINALRVAKKELPSARIVINGAGSAGIAICKMLLSLGAKDIILVDKNGAVNSDESWLNSEQRLMSEITNPRNIHGGLKDAIKDADAFIGVSAPGVLKPEMVRSMAERAIVFAMANPEPEIYPDEAKAAGALVVGTGRSDFPNQINNVIAFPGIFRGALDARASRITEEMKKAATYALADLITPDELSADNIIPGSLDPRTAKAVAAAVAAAVK